MKKFFNLMCLISMLFSSSILLSSVAFSASRPRLFFWVLDGGYAFPRGSMTQGNLEMYGGGDLLVNDDNVSYRRTVLPRLSFGYDVTPWLSFLVSAQHVRLRVLTEPTRLALDGSHETFTYVSNVMIKSVFAKIALNAGGYHADQSLKIRPFLVLGVGVSFWRHAGGYVPSQHVTLISLSGKNASYLLGLGVRNQINDHLSIDYGVDYMKLAEYRSSHFGYGDGWNAAMRQVLSASICVVAPYVGLHYAL